MSGDNWRIIDPTDRPDLEQIHRAVFMTLLDSRGHDLDDWTRRADRWWPTTTVVRPRGASA